MGTNLSFILSLFFVIQVMMMGGDILNIQTINTELNAIASYVVRTVQTEGSIKEKTIEYVLSVYNSRLVCLENCKSRFGDTLRFKVERDYHAISYLNKSITITVSRSILLGYFN